MTDVSTEQGKQSNDTKTAKRATKTRKRNRVVEKGVVYIYASFNNTLVTITDTQGNPLASSSAATCGYKGSRKSTPFAAGQAAHAAATKAVNDFSMVRVDVKVKGPGPGREMAVRSLSDAGLAVLSIEDVTGNPFNGCRPPKKRRV